MFAWSKRAVQMLQSLPESVVSQAAANRTLLYQVLKRNLSTPLHIIFWKNTRCLIQLLLNFPVFSYLFRSFWRSLYLVKCSHPCCLALSQLAPRDRLRLVLMPRERLRRPSTVGRGAHDSCRRANPSTLHPTFAAVTPTS